MHKTKDVLDELRKKYGSDRKAAIALEITQQTFSEWRTGKTHPSDEMAKKISVLLGMNDGYVVALIHADKAKDADIRELWRNMAKHFRNAAMLAAFTAAPFLLPPPAQAGTSHNQNFSGSATQYTLRDRRRRARRSSFAAAVALILGGGCTTVDTHTAPPADWPALEIVVERVPHATMRERCARYAPPMFNPEACTEVFFAERRCRITLSADLGTQEHERHEFLHCAGHDHVGDDTLARAWRTHRAAEAGEALGRALSRRP